MRAERPERPAVGRRRIACVVGIRGGTWERRNAKRARSTKGVFSPV